MQKRLFIINPVSGTKHKNNLEALLSKSFLSEYDIAYTEYKGHAIKLAEEAVKNDYKTVVAVGGDGTVNEVAQALRNTETALYILPKGSGNGLARHFNIPLNIEKAIEGLNSAKIRTIDTAELNEIPFFCTAGIGFDAQVGQKFAEAGTRGLKTYVRTSLNTFFNYKSEFYKIKHDTGSINAQAFLLTFANTSQYGNNAIIAPEADPSDGFITGCILGAFPLFAIPGLGRKLFSGSIHRSKYMTTLNSKMLVVERENEGFAHVDGEPIKLGKTLTVRILPGSLKIWMP